MMQKRIRMSVPVKSQVRVATRLDKGSGSPSPDSRIERLDQLV
jgi:hypothetical protein